MNQFLPWRSQSLGFIRWEFALALIVLGSRLSVFAYAGSPLPYYDQWVMEFNDTLMSIPNGNGFSVLLFRHNGHLLVTTKLLTVFGYSVNGYWDVSFLVICAAGVRALTAAWTFKLIACSARPETKSLLWLLCVVTFAAPYSGFNFLNGMQICFYLADIALLWSLRTTTNWTTPITSGLALIGGTIFGVASLASAVAIPACTILAHLFQRRTRPGFWPAWIISAMIAFGFVLTGGSPEAVAAGLPQLHFQAIAYFWLQIISWPAHFATLGALLVIVWSAALVFTLKSASGRTAANATIVSLGLFAGINAAFIALNRAPGEWHTRHWETIALLPLATLAFGLRLADLNGLMRPILYLTGCLALGFVFCAGNLVRTVSWPYIEAAHENRSAAIDHYRGLLLQQDFHMERDRINTLLENRNYAFFDDPIGRYSLHPAVLENLQNFHRRPLTMLSPEIIPVRNKSRFSGFTDRLIACGWLLGLFGIIMGIAAMLREFGRLSNRPAASR